MGKTARSHAVRGQDSDVRAANRTGARCTICPVRMRRLVGGVCIGLAVSLSGLHSQSGTAPGRPDYPIRTGAVHRGASERRVLGAADRDQPHREHSGRVRTVRADRTRQPLRAAARRCAVKPIIDKRPPGYPFDDTDLYKVIEGASYSLSVSPGSEARCVRRRPDREDRRRAGTRRLPLHDAHDRSEDAASLGRARTLGARA